MPRGTRARKVQQTFKKKQKPKPKPPEGTTFDGELGPEELELPRAMAKARLRDVMRKLLKRHL